MQNDQLTTVKKGFAETDSIVITHTLEAGIRYMQSKEFIQVITDTNT